MSSHSPFFFSFILWLPKLLLIRISWFYKATILTCTLFSSCHYSFAWRGLEKHHSVWGNASPSSFSSKWLRGALYSPEYAHFAPLTPSFINIAAVRTAPLHRVQPMTAVRYYEGFPSPPPPDLSSLLLSERIVFVGTVLSPKVTELIIAELLFLEYDSVSKPITMYINSPGTETYSGEPVAFETEALAVVDVMNYVRPIVRTVCVGQAFGTAAMLLANGEKSNRFILPSATVLLKQPVGFMRTGQASDIALGAKEKLHLRNGIISVIAKSTGKSFDTVLNDVQRNKYFTAQESVEYGLTDAVLASAERKELLGIHKSSHVTPYNSYSPRFKEKHQEDVAGAPAIH